MEDVSETTTTRRECVIVPPRSSVGKAALALASVSPLEMLGAFAACGGGGGMEDESNDFTMDNGNGNPMSCGAGSSSSPTSFFRKTHPDNVEPQDHSYSDCRGRQLQRNNSNISKSSKRLVKFDLDSEILNIVNGSKGGGSVSGGSLMGSSLRSSGPSRQPAVASSRNSIRREQRDDNMSSSLNWNEISSPSSSTIASSPSNLSKQSKASTSSRRKEQPSTLAKFNQALLSSSTDIASPKITVDGDVAAVSDDKNLHFFSYATSPPPSANTTNTPFIPKWIKSTTVNVENTYCMNISIHNTTAIVGVPYDRNIKGLLTGAAYIFERDTEKEIWIQVKKIVPKDVSEFATVGYSVGICGDVICVSVPNVGNSSSGGVGKELSSSSTTAAATSSSGGAASATGEQRIGGCVHVYKRVNKYKWAEKGRLLPPTETETRSLGVLASAGGNGIIVKNTKVSTKKKFGTRVAIQGNIIVVSDHFNHDDTSIYVYEYNPSSPSINKWDCIQSDLLSEGQSRHFGSRLALTNDGNGILIGCHSKMNPTEVLYYSRYGMGGKYHLQQVIMISKRSSSSKSGIGRVAVGRNVATEDITDFKVNGINLILGTTTSQCGQLRQNHCVYVYQLQPNDTWNLMAKVDDPSLDKFGQCVGLAGNRVLIGAKNNAYSYKLGGIISENKRKIFMENIKLEAEKKRKQKMQLNTQVFGIDSEYSELPYVGADLNEFRSRQRKMTAQRQDEKSSQNLTGTPPSRLSLGMARPKMTKMLRMRSPSPILRRMRGAPPRNVSAPPLRASPPTIASLVQY